MVYLRKTEDKRLPYAVGEFHFAFLIFVFIIPTFDDENNFLDETAYLYFWKTFKHFYLMKKFKFEDFSDSTERNIQFNLIFNEYSDWNQFFHFSFNQKKKEENLQKLQEIASLKDNWNENGAKCFSKFLMEKTFMIVESLDRQPEIFPTAGDSIQLEYDGINGAYLEFQITEDKMVEVYKIDEKGKETERKILSNSEAINQEVSEFYKFE